MRMFLVTMLLLCVAVGCTRYEYNITQPPDLAQHIGKQERAVRQGPLGYRMVTYDNRLIMRIENVTEDPIRIDGEQSWIVTPDGQSRPLVSQAIAPGAHVRLILPPMARVVERGGPSVGLGVGFGFGGGRRRAGTGVGVGVPLGGSRTQVYDVDAYWEWPAGQEIRLHIVGGREGENFTHDFTINRQKM